jgi:dTDP-4-dehydrorhamnose reductase
VTVLVTGGGGLLGPWLCEAVVNAALGPIVAPSSHECDLGDPDAVRSLCEQTRPTIVLHAAALTDVDRCEREPVLAARVNTAACAHLAASLPSQAQLVMVSTDQVYPDFPGPHGPTGPAPVNVYGRTKLAGEAAVRRHPRGLVLRTNLFGPSRTVGRRSLSDWIVEELSAQRGIVGFTDVLFSPLHLATLSRLTVAAARAGLVGTLNLGSHEGLSKYAFARSVAARLRLDPDLVRPGLSHQRPGAAPRPHDLRLDVTAAEQQLGEHLPDLRSEIDLLESR